MVNPKQNGVSGVDAGTSSLVDGESQELQDKQVKLWISLPTSTIPLALSRATLSVRCL